MAVVFGLVTDNRATELTDAAAFVTLQNEADAACIRHRVLLFSAGPRHGSPPRVRAFAPHRGADMGSPEGLPCFSMRAFCDCHGLPRKVKHGTEMRRGPVRHLSIGVQKR